MAMTAMNLIFYKHEALSWVVKGNKNRCVEQHHRSKPSQIYQGSPCVAVLGFSHFTLKKATRFPCISQHLWLNLTCPLGFG